MWSDGRYAMGTVLEITLVSRDPRMARSALESSFAGVARLEAMLSRFESESELNQLNRGSGQGSRAVSPDLAEILRLARQYGELTGGSFDVTVGPLVSLWIEAARLDRAPSRREIEEARALVDFRRIGIDPAGRVELPVPGMSVDLGAVAKGFALDRMAAELETAKLQGALLSFGQSSLWAQGAPPREPSWRLALRAPDGGLAGFVQLRDRAFSVSSSLGQWSEIEGRRYGHVIDPRTGLALERGLQASVVSGNATLAEALSTALVVLDPDRGIALVESVPETEARILDESGVVHTSSGWRAETGFESFVEPVD
jgi:thiamine biosynthesis lipoprotein